MSKIDLYKSDYLEVIDVGSDNLKDLIGDRNAIVEVVRYVKHKNGFSISFLDSMGIESSMMFSVSHNIKLLLEDAVIEKGLFDE